MAKVQFVGWKTTPKGDIFTHLYVNPEGPKVLLPEAFHSLPKSEKEGFSLLSPGQHEGYRVKQLLKIKKLHPVFNRIGGRS